MQTVVKKWFREKDYGFLDNGSGPDIKVSKADLVNCQYLKTNSTVELECHLDNGKLIAKKVKLIGQRDKKKWANGKPRIRKNPFGVMT